MSGLIWVYTVCQDLSVRKLRIIAVNKVSGLYLWRSASVHNFSKDSYCFYLNFSTLWNKRKKMLHVLITTRNLFHLIMETRFLTSERLVVIREADNWTNSLANLAGSKAAQTKPHLMCTKDFKLLKSFPIDHTHVQNQYTKQVCLLGTTKYTQKTARHWKAHMSHMTKPTKWVPSLISLRSALNG